MNKQKEQEFKFKCERLARAITKKTDIIFTEIRYTEVISEVYYMAEKESERMICYCSNTSDRRISNSKIRSGFKNRIEVTFVGCGVGAQKFNAARRNSINRILKTNAKISKDKETQTQKIIITFIVNPHKM